MRALVVSDLHLGGATGADVLRHDGVPRARLLEALDGVDVLVLLGDTLELRHGPARRALAAAAPGLQAIGDALAPGAEVVLVAGNHDHALVGPWLDHTTRPLGLETRVRPTTASPLGRRMADLLGAQRTSVAYPGVWLRDDVYAVHGHYLDVHGTVPTFERIAAGVMLRLGAALPEGPCVAEDYERALAPLYAWMHSAAQRAPEGRMAAGSGRAARTYEMLQGDGHRPVRSRLLAAAFPLGVKGLSRLVGPLQSDLRGHALRRNGIVAHGEALRRLGVDAAHVVYGHTHRTGPLPGDDHGEWVAPLGSRLHNCGSWVYETHFLSGSEGSSPYWPGGAVVVEGDADPRVVRLLENVPAAALRAPDPA